MNCDVMIWLIYIITCWPARVGKDPETLSTSLPGESGSTHRCNAPAIRWKLKGEQSYIEACWMHRLLLACDKRLKLDCSAGEMVDSVVEWSFHSCLVMVTKVRLGQARHIVAHVTRNRVWKVWSNSWSLRHVDQCMLQDILLRHPGKVFNFKKNTRFVAITAFSLWRCSKSQVLPCQILPILPLWSLLCELGEQGGSKMSWLPFMRRTKGSSLLIHDW